MEHGEPPGRFTDNASNDARIGVSVTLPQGMANDRYQEQLDDAFRVPHEGGKMSLASTPIMLICTIDNMRERCFFITSPKPGYEERVKEILLSEVTRWASVARGEVSPILHHNELATAVRPQSRV